MRADAVESAHLANKAYHVACVDAGDDKDS